jgi:methionyl-tRNA formyltransferase
VNIVFLGSGAFGLPTLRWATGAHRVVGIVTQPDRPAGRSRVPTPTPVGAWAAESAPGVPIVKPEDVNEPGVRDLVRAWDADAWVVIAFGQKLSTELLADRFAINLHASLLPRWRGAAPINHAILAGDAETGNSVITIAQRMDAGFVLHQTRRPIDPLVTAGELHDLLSEDGPAAIDAVLRDHGAGTVRFGSQDESLVTRARKLSRADDRIDFAVSARECRCRVHGLTPWPGITVDLGGAEVKLVRVEEVEAGPEQRGVTPGAVVDPTAGVIACGAGTALRALEVHPAGKRVMRWEEFVRGRALPSGIVARTPSREASA